MEIINVYVKNQNITCDRQYLVTDTREIYECHFHFEGEEWEGATCTAVFKYSDTEAPEKALVDNVAIIPVEAIENIGYLNIGIYGVKGGEQLYPTVFTQPILLLLGSYMHGHPLPTPDVYLQLVSLYNQLLLSKQDKLPDFVKNKYLKVIENEDGELELAWEDGGGGGGTGDYNDLSNRPQINGYTLEGNKSATSLGIALKDNLDEAIARINTLVSDLTSLGQRVSTNETNISNTQSDVEDIQEVIPNQASSTNKLADKDFVNSSIATQTAYFQGTFSLEDLGLEYGATHLEIETALETIVGEKTNNDYVFVSIENLTTEIIEKYERYKYTSDDSSWNFEYELNNSSFTAEQWATINSGITSLQVAQITTNATNITNLSGRVDDVEYDIENLQDSTLKKPSTFQVGQFFKVSSIDSEGNPVLQATDIQEGLPILTGTTAPTTSTVGKVGQLYLVDVSNSRSNKPVYDSYICTNANQGVYTWQNILTNLNDRNTSTVFIYGSRNNANAVADTIVCLGKNNSAYYKSAIFGTNNTGDHEGSCFGNGNTAAKGFAFGLNSRVSGTPSRTLLAWAMGYEAIAQGDGAMQIGTGTNTTPMSLDIGFGYNNNFKIIDATGKIPSERVDTITKAGTYKYVCQNLHQFTVTHTSKYRYGDYQTNRWSEDIEFTPGTYTANRQTFGVTFMDNNLFIVQQLFENDLTDIVLDNHDTVIYTEPITSLSVTLIPDVNSNADYVTGVNFKAGANFSLTENVDTDYAIHWSETPTWTQGKVYEVIYRCLWIEDDDGKIIISAKYNEV